MKVEKNIKDLLEATATSNGIYSLYKGWLKTPVRDDIPDVELEPELSEWVSRSENCNTIEEITNFIDDIYKLRQDSILEDGEYGKGNLIFKQIRNRGILQELRNKKIDLENKEMSIGLEEGWKNDEENQSSAAADAMKKRKPIEGKINEILSPVERALANGIENILDVNVAAPPLFEYPNNISIDVEITKPEAGKADFTKEEIEKIKSDISNIIENYNLTMRSFMPSNYRSYIHLYITAKSDDVENLIRTLYNKPNLNRDYSNQEVVKLVDKYHLVPSWAYDRVYDEIVAEFNDEDLAKAVVRELEKIYVNNINEEKLSDNEHYDILDLEELVNRYAYSSKEDYDDIYSDIMAEFGNENLANDVIEALEQISRGDFVENRVLEENKMPEWQKNLEQLKEKCVKEYRELTGTTDEILTEDKINDWELNRVSCRNNFDADDLRDILLGRE